MKLEAGMGRSRGNGKQSAPSTGDGRDLEPPSGLRGITFSDGENRYMMLSFGLEGAEPPPSLTTAEREVLEAVLEGLSNAAIAQRRGTSSRTVANQIAALFRKFRASSRLDLARRASTLFVLRRDSKPPGQ